MQPNARWFFVDFSNDSIPKNRKFDVLLKGENRKLVPWTTKVKLTHILDQFGHSLQHIPLGYKTVCKFEFSPSIPESVKGLKALDGWDYNSDSLSFASHEDINLSSPDAIFNDLLSIAYFELKKNFAKTSRALSGDDVVNLLIHDFHTKPENARNILSRLVQLGKIRKIQNDEIEFAEV